MLFNRVIELFIFPPGILILTGFTGLWLTRSHRKTGTGLLVITLLLFWLVSTPWFSYRLLNSLQQQFPTQHQVPPGVDSIVVLGGSIKTSGDNFQLSSDSYERVQTAAMLARKSGLPLVTTGSGLFGATRSAADVMAEVLEKNFSLTTVIIEEQSRTTWEHPHKLKPLLKQYGFKNPIIVTHAWHMPRAIFAFKQQQLAVSPWPAAHSQPLMIERGFMQYLPSARSIERTRIALHEWLGFQVYRIKSV